MKVKKRLWKVGGEEHVVKIGDVGDGEFWRGLRGEVRFFLLLACERVGMGLLEWSGGECLN
jgi:hypothetical protein